MVTKSTAFTMTCPGCKATWVPRVERPIRCPRCFKVLVK